MPALRSHNEPAFAAALQKLFVHGPGVVQHDLVSAGEDEGGGQALKLPEEGGDKGIALILCVAVGVKAQKRFRHRGVDIPVRLVGSAGSRQIRPWGDADKPAGQGKAPFPEAQTEGVYEPAPGTLAAEADLPRSIALGEQIAVALLRVIQSGGKGELRRQPVSCAEHPRPALCGQRGAKALGIFQITAGIAAAVKVENHPGAALIPGDDPGSLKVRKGVVLQDNIPPVHGLHQLSQLVLPFPGHFKRAGGHKGLEKIKLCSDKLRRQSHSGAPFMRCAICF